MASVTATQIRDLLKVGVFTDTTLTDDRFYVGEQPKSRRRYPSVEVKETKPESHTETKEKSEFATTYSIVYYKRTRGGQTTGSEDEEVLIETTQNELLAIVETISLEDHKIVSEAKDWDVKRFAEQVAPYIESTLRLTVRRITAPPAGTPDGVLIYQIAGSTGDNLPAGDYTYLQAYNAEVNDGHNKFDEYTSQSKNPKRYAGGFRGSFICSVRVSATDLGATSDKLNQLTKLRSNGALPEVEFQWSNKDLQPTPSTIQEILKMTIDDVQRQYKTGDTTVYRILGSLLEDTVTTVI